MRTNVNCEAVQVLAKDINSINESIGIEIDKSVNILNSIKNIWKDYNSEAIIDDMILIVSTLNNVRTDLSTLTNFCTKATNSYTTLDTDFEKKLIEGDINE